MSERQGFIDDNRALLALAGADAREVLQGVVTNDIGKLKPDAAVYAALLTPQGKYLSDFFLIDGGDGVVLIDAPADHGPTLSQKLKMYCLRRDAQIFPQPRLSVACVWPDMPEVMGPGLTAVPDPRVPALGWRLYGTDRQALEEALGQPGSRSDYDRLRVANLVPEGGVELVPDETYILEAGFERLRGVDFKKGCYVGQEVTARMKHKTALRKGLVRVDVQGEAEAGSPIVANGKPAGTLFTVSDGRGLAHLRLDRAGPGMQAGTATVDYVPQDQSTEGSEP